MKFLQYKVLLLLIGHAHEYIRCNDIQIEGKKDQKNLVINSNGCQSHTNIVTGFPRADTDGSSNESIDTELNDIVQRQYLMLPYPPFTKQDLENEENYYQSSEDMPPLLFSFLIQLEYINHYLFQGKNDFLRDFRVLMAGGGTGPTTMVMAEQLNHTESEVVFLDFSRSSMKVAQGRARARKLKNIVWVTEGIENIQRLNLIKFDFMQCSGVLHHLKSPINGLNILKESLHLVGGIDLMVYGTYGRTGVYQLQHMLKMINYQTNDINDELKNTNIVLNSLPRSNWFKKQEDAIDDHKIGDAGTYDLLLHKRDVSYSVSELLIWIKSSGLLTVRYTTLDVPPIGGRKEDPELYGIKHFRKYFDGERLVQDHMHKVTELFYRDGEMQNAFVSHSDRNEAQLYNVDNVLFIPGDEKCPPGFKNRVMNIKTNEKTFVSRIVELAKGTTFRTGWPLNKVSQKLLKVFVRYECRVALDILFRTFRKNENSKLTDDELVQNLLPFYNLANKAGFFLLKSSKVNAFPKSNSPTFRFDSKFKAS